MDKPTAMPIAPRGPDNAHGAQRRALFGGAVLVRGAAPEPAAAASPAARRGAPACMARGAEVGDKPDLLRWFDAQQGR